MPQCVWNNISRHILLEMRRDLWCCCTSIVPTPRRETSTKQRNTRVVCIHRCKHRKCIYIYIYVVALLKILCRYVMVLLIIFHRSMKHYWFWPFFFKFCLAFMQKFHQIPILYITTFNSNLTVCYIMIEFLGS